MNVGRRRYLGFGVCVCASRTCRVSNERRYPAVSDRVCAKADVASDCDGLSKLLRMPLASAPSTRAVWMLALPVYPANKRHSDERRCRTPPGRDGGWAGALTLGHDEIGMFSPSSHGHIRRVRKHGPQEKNRMGSIPAARRTRAGGALSGAGCEQMGPLLFLSLLFVPPSLPWSAVLASHCHPRSSPLPRLKLPPSLPPVQRGLWAS
ncbi:hypothetical protein BC628DRAFT_857584 [Trametes gibbosa]|nr:hypothetical protein BC628DRAFT_857584 [Trametes gibbosa]